MENGDAAFSVNENLETASGQNLKNILSQNDVLVFIESSKIAIYQNGEKKILTPAGEGNYIWPSVSPDKSKLLFTLAGKGTFVSDLNGNIISQIGYANAPKWSADSKWIVYMVDKDDGLRVTSSELYVVSADGNTKIQLTKTQEILEMYPEFDSTGGQVVCNTYDGKILLLKLSAEF